MSEDDHILEVCSGRAAWQVIPNEELAIDLESVGAKIVAAGWTCTLENRLCHTFSGEVDLTLFPSGKLLVKTADRDAAAQIARTHLDEWLN
jgi:hypothetical protein